MRSRAFAGDVRQKLLRFLRHQAEYSLPETAQFYQNNQHYNLNL
jgi:hypothetical protein